MGRHFDVTHIDLAQFGGVLEHLAKLTLEKTRFFVRQIQTREFGDICYVEIRFVRHLV